MPNISTSTAATLTAVDFSKLPFTSSINTRTYEDILAEMLSDVRFYLGTDYIFHEADPAYVVLEACAMRRFMDLQDYANQCKQMYVAYANGAMLDQLGANPDFKCTRLTVVAANPAASPPVDAVMESDEAYRARLVLTNEGYTSAGTDGAYLYHTLSADGDVRDASVTSPQAGTALITVLSFSNNGLSSSALVDKIRVKLNRDDLRQTCATVNVAAAEVLNYTAAIRVATYPSTDIQSTLARSQTSLQAYVDAHFKLGHDITLAGLVAASTVDGVQNVFIDAPATDLITSYTQARRCTSALVSHGGVAL